jgi:hypothetical protein
MTYDSLAWHRAAFAWLVAGVYQFARTPELSFVSWHAVAFFTLGTATAGAVFCWLDYLCTRALAKLIAEHPLSSSPDVEAQRLRALGRLLALLPPTLAFIAGLGCALLFKES